LEQEYFFPVSGIYLEFKGQILTEELQLTLAVVCVGEN
jgi:hypothetical protein